MSGWHILYGVVSGVLMDGMVQPACCAPQKRCCWDAGLYLWMYMLYPSLGKCWQVLAAGASFAPAIAVLDGMLPVIKPLMPLRTSAASSRPLAIAKYVTYLGGNQ
jgi:hypothetical protein